MELIPYYCNCRVLILGVGNTLFGDDGFGSYVIKHLQESCNLPEDVVTLDAGTRIREILFVISLSKVKPEKIIIIDAIDIKRTPGEILEVDIGDNSQSLKEINDFFTHQIPTCSLLKELKDMCKTDIKIFVCQVENIPDGIKIGLSDTLQKAISELEKKIFEEIKLQ